MGSLRWLLSGLLFALVVALAVGTAALRATNIGLRRQLEREFQAIELRAVELRRLSAIATDATAPERLAARLRELQREQQERQAAALAAAAEAQRHELEATAW